jgi:hypothetical protein
MRNRLIGAIGAASFALTTILATSTGASAFSGLSAKQKAHIDEYFMCKTLLLTDVAAFNATEPCGGTPSGDTASMSGAKSGTGIVKEHKPHDKKWWKKKKKFSHHKKCDSPQQSRSSRSGPGPKGFSQSSFGSSKNCGGSRRGGVH